MPEFPSGAMKLLGKSTLTGKPVRASAVVVSCQFPAMALAMPRWFSIGLPTPKGS